MLLHAAAFAAIIALAGGAPVDLPPHMLDFASALNSKVDALTPAGRAAFFKQQAELQRMFGNVDALAKNFHPVSTKQWPQAKAASSPKPSMMTNGFGAPSCTPLKFTVPPIIAHQNFSTCLVTTDTQNIDDPVYGLASRTTTGWADGHVPPSLRGIFYMEGNPLPSECLSTANSVWNGTSQMWELPVWQPRAWSGSPNVLGKLDQEGLRYTGSTFRFTCAEGEAPDWKETNLKANGTVCQITQYALRYGAVVEFGDYFTVQVNENRHIRATVLKMLRGLDGKYVNYYYNLWRIVDEQGERTPSYYDNYVSQIGKSFGYAGQPFAHLESTQYVALRM